MIAYKKAITLLRDSFEQNQNGLIIIICGISIIAVVLSSQYFFILSYINNGYIIQYNLENFNEIKISSLYNISLFTFIIIIFGLILTIIGIKSVLKVLATKTTYNYELSSKSKRKNLLFKLKNLLTKNIILLSSVFYFILISFLSNTFIYSTSSFFENYQIKSPSFHIISCCGYPGYYPVLSIYLTDHFGALLIPINLILSSILSLLIGINVSLLINKIRQTITSNKKNGMQQICRTNTKKSSTMISLAAFIGLFIECPVCAGSFFIYIFGGNFAIVGITSTIVIVTQPFFVITSFILLMIPPFLARIDKF